MMRSAAWTCFSNWLMVGISDKPKTGNTVWKEMYYGKQHDEEDSWYRRQEFTSPDTRALRFTSRFGYHVTAILESGLKALATVTLVPRYERDVDPEVLSFIKGEGH